MCIDRLSQYQSENAVRKIICSKCFCICVLIVGAYVAIALLCYLYFCGIFFAIKLIRP
jgi:hypothetical protein